MPKPHPPVAATGTVQLTIPPQNITTMFQLITNAVFSAVTQTPPSGPNVPTITNGNSLDQIVVRTKHGTSCRVQLVLTLDDPVFSLAGAVVNSMPEGKCRKSFPGWAVDRDGTRSTIILENIPITDQIGMTTFPYIIFVQQHGKNIGNKPAIGVIDPDIGNDTGA